MSYAGYEMSQYEMYQYEMSRYEVSGYEMSVPHITSTSNVHWIYLCFLAVTVAYNI